MTPKEPVDRLNESEDFDLPKSYKWRRCRDWVCQMLSVTEELHINLVNLGQMVLENCRYIYTSMSRLEIRL